MEITKELISKLKLGDTITYNCKWSGMAITSPVIAVYKKTNGNANTVIVLGSMINLSGYSTLDKDLIWAAYEYLEGYKYYDVIRLGQDIICITIGNRSAMLAVAVKTGCNCISCNDYNEWAAPNQKDGTFRCYRCRN